MPRLCVLEHSGGGGCLCGLVGDLDTGCIGLEVLLCLALQDDLLELITVNVLLLHQHGGGVVQDVNVALDQVLGTPVVEHSNED